MKWRVRHNNWETSKNFVRSLSNRSWHTLLKFWRFFTDHDHKFLISKWYHHDWWNDIKRNSFRYIHIWFKYIWNILMTYINYFWIKIIHDYNMHENTYYKYDYYFLWSRVIRYWKDSINFPVSVLIWYTYDWRFIDFNQYIFRKYDNF